MDKSTEVAAGKAAALAVPSGTVLPCADKREVDASTILNYNENMEYRW